MKRVYKFFRALLSTIAVIAVVVPALVYILLSLGPVQRWIKDIAQNELSEQLGARVLIDDLNIRPFNRADISGIKLVVDTDTVAVVGHLSAGIDVWQLVTSGRITINYATVMDVYANINRLSKDSPLNIQPIIDRLSRHDPDKPKSRFDLRVNTVVIRNLNARYDVLDAQPAVDGRFDPSHIVITGLRADASLPRLSNNRYAVDLKRLDLRERSGFRLDNVTGRILLSDSIMQWQNIKVEAPRSGLYIADGELRLDSISGIARAVGSKGVTVGIKTGSRFYPPSFAMFLPAFGDVDTQVDISLSAQVKSDELSLTRLYVDTPDRLLSVNIEDAVVKNILDHDKMTYQVPDLNVSLSGRLATFSGFAMPKRVVLPDRVTLVGSTVGDMLAGQAKLSLETTTSHSVENDVEASLTYHRRTVKSPVTVKGQLRANDFDVSSVADITDLESLSLLADIEGEIGHGRRQLMADVTIDNLVYRRHRYDRMHINGSVNGEHGEATVTLFDSDADMSVNIDADMTRGHEHINVDVDMKRLDLNELNLVKGDRMMVVSGKMFADVSGLRPDRGDALIDIRDVRVQTSPSHTLIGDSLVIESHSSTLPRNIVLRSDIVNGYVTGDYDFATLGATLKQIVTDAVPVLDDGRHAYRGKSGTSRGVNRFEFAFTVDETEPLGEIIKMPITTVYPATISGSVDSEAMKALVDVDVPFIRQGNKLIEGTRLVAAIDGLQETHALTLETKYPSNDGLTTYTVDSRGVGNETATDIGWRIDRKRLYDGDIHLDTRLGRDDRGEISAAVKVLPGHLTFNDSVWTIHPATIDWAERTVRVDGVNVSRDNQYVRIDGIGTSSDADTITIDVCRVDLDYVFGAIGIENFQLGGLATGQLYATSVVSPMPHVVTPGIKVDNIAYNQCVLGQGLVTCTFDMSDKAFKIDGIIDGDKGNQSTISGRLFPFSSELDFYIHADETPVGFMGYYMKAFASDISGYGSGDMHLFGNFHDVDLEGDVYARDFNMRLDFTNTYFGTTDTIHITPGRIVLDDVTIHDPYGHTGRLSGTVTHDFFRSPRFDFKVSDVDNMLVYNEPARPNADWYGRIFATGGAEVNGDDTTVRINIDVKTNDNSLFTFILSELEIADEYTFLTFRDKNALNDSIKVEEDVKLSAVNALRERLSRKANVTSANYIIEVKVDITPDIEVDLVMDPVAGDRIRSHGSGNLRMLYTSSDEDLRIFGTYRLDRGDYNFTLQDIIIRDFVIKDGSTISFTGDPLTARLNIEAYYALNANLTDLDESFSQDKELNRTNIPVHALLKVTGDIQDPQIAFDLEFPTLNSDTDRKIRSIISTDEMLNRQIIYLLALNRFYTPDYMSTTKGNELFSVASSTISSQLSNMLGQLSDKWVIAPNIRSDRGDFSDMEVDLALGSRLLNNRLLLNGNFGYRDKSLNTNQFIGDFDIEYLLNKSGTIRLKAYNHFNDQNYYVRTANTTQGVGVMFKHDFDNIFGFLRRKSHPSQTAPADSLPGDTVLQEIDDHPTDTISIKQP